MLTALKFVPFAAFSSYFAIIGVYRVGIEKRSGEFWNGTGCFFFPLVCLFYETDCDKLTTTCVCLFPVRSHRCSSVSPFPRV